MKWPAQWEPVSEGESLEAELRRELIAGHPLYGLAVRAVARRVDNDDVLFEITDSSARHALVHLTWSGKPERSPKWPWTQVFPGLSSFMRRFGRNRTP